MYFTDLDLQLFTQSLPVPVMIHVHHDDHGLYLMSSSSSHANVFTGILNLTPISKYILPYKFLY